MISNIGIIHISPKADGSRKVFPHILIFPYTFFTLFDKRLKSVYLDLILSINRQLIGLISRRADAKDATRCLILDDTDLPKRGTGPRASGRCFLTLR